MKLSQSESLWSQITRKWKNEEKLKKLQTNKVASKEINKQNKDWIDIKKFNQIIEKIGILLKRYPKKELVKNLHDNF